MTTAAQRFLTQQEAFTAKVSSNRHQVSTRARWDIGGSYRIRSAPHAKGALTVDTDMERLAVGFVEQAAPIMAEAQNQHLVPVAQSAFDRWSVKTGLSKSLLSIKFVLSSDRQSLTGSIVNLAPYAGYIYNNKETGVLNSANYRGLVFVPGQVAAEAMAAEIAKKLGV